MKGKLIVIFLNLIVLFCAFFFSRIPDQNKSVLVKFLVGIGIIIFLVWSFGDGNFKLYRLVKLPDEQFSAKQATWNFLKILIGGVIVWNLLFQLL